MAALNPRVLPQFVLSLVFLALYAVLIWYVFSGTAQIPENLLDIAKILIGMMTMALTQVVGFFFQSSAGSKDKDKP